jgi:GT2 family glycosyltransferase
MKNYDQNRPHASIIVLCYNSLEEATKPCLDSILAHTPLENYELIIIDNASSDGTAEYLKVFAAQNKNVQIQLNETNKGYSAGNNDGMRLAQGEYIVLLNNDTLVQEKWLESLLQLFNHQNKIGLIGPITNSSGNEQCVHLDGLNENNFEEISTKYINRQQGVWFTTNRLGFFCVAMHRTMLETVGYLDENFGLGMFEDDDYCIRIQKAGFDLAVVEDCFIYHKGSVSFKKLKESEYRYIFEKNKAYFREKHHVEWTFTEISLAYWKKSNNDLHSYVKNQPNIPPEIERIVIRNEQLKHLLLHVHNIELESIAAHIRAASSEPLVVSTKWFKRWNYFKSNMIKGSLPEKWCYLRTLPIRVLSCRKK